MKILKLPARAFENDGFRGWAVSKHHYSPEFHKRNKWFVAEKKKLVAQVKASR